MIPRTWNVTPELARRVNATAEEHGLWPSDLVRFLLTAALDQLDRGTLEIPTCSIPPNCVDWSRYIAGVGERGVKVESR